MLVVFRLVLCAASLALVVAVAPPAQAQGKWHNGPPIPEGANEVIGAQVGELLLVYGGQDPQSRAQGLFFRFDPAKNEWARLPSNAVPVHHAAAVGIGRR